MQQNLSVCQRQMTEDDGVKGRRGGMRLHAAAFWGKQHTWRDDGSLSISLSVKNEKYKEDNNKNSKMSGQAEASPLLKAALGFMVKMCCLLQKHASPPAQN